jgi:ankyrin repeat protein
MAQPVAKRQKLVADDDTIPQLQGVRYDNTTAHGNSRNVYGNVINTYHVSPQQAPAGPKVTPDAPCPIRSHIQSILKNLEFEQMDDRLATIATAHSDTCQWLFEGEKYKAWRHPDALNTDRGFLWLKGKPGAGKSTLMKSARHYGEREHSDTVISFFFNARGVELQKSTQGMYRSLLYQLLKKRMEQLAALSKHEGYSQHLELLESFVEKSLQRRSHPASQNWPVELLKDTLRDLVLAFRPAQVARCANASGSYAGPETAQTYRDSVLALAATQVTCYVDALDECENHDARDMIDFLGTLRAVAAGAHVGFRVLLTSRHYPHITFNACQELNLDSQKGHEADIVEYVRSKLYIGGSKLALEIQSVVQTRACGVFLWVVLVVRILNELYDRGQIRRLRQRLEAIPGGLHELFREILQETDQDGEERLLVFQWLLFSHKPLRLGELYHVVTRTFESGEDVESFEHNNVREYDMRRFLLNASKGLAEMTEGTNPTVQFIHESVKDYLLNVGLIALNPSLGIDVVSQCHARLQECCRRYLESAQITLSPLLVKATSEENLVARQALLRKAGSTCPFLNYAIKGVLYHADSAHTPKLPQDKIVTSFQYQLWRELYNLTHPKYRLSAEVSPLYILTITGACNLVEIHINTHGMSRPSPKEILPEHHRSLLGSAVANFDRRMVAMLLGRGIGANWPAINNHTCMSLAVKNGDAQMVQMLIDAGASADMDVNDPWGSPKLGSNLRRANEDIILKILASAFYTARWHEDFNWILYNTKKPIRRRVEQTLMHRLESIVGDVERADEVFEAEPYHDLALLAACMQNRPDLIAPLAGYGVNLDVKHASDKAGLCLAAERRFESVVRVLLELGADPNVRRLDGTYLAHDMSREGCEGILRMLLESGANPSAADRMCNLTSPLHMAARYANATAARLLIDHGADVNAADEKLKVPLHEAVKSKDGAVARLLIAHGADICALDVSGNSALVTASRYGHTEIVDMLLEAGDPVPTKQLDEAASEALHHWQDVVVERLVQKGAKQPLLRLRRVSSAHFSSTSEEYRQSTPEIED